MNRFHLVKIKKSYGLHTDVYVDFEKQILEKTGWRFVNETNKYIQWLFNKYVLSKLKSKRLSFNLPLLNSRRYLFAIISGTQYSKIFLSYSSRARLKVIYMFDPWPSVNKINENAFRSFRINIAFISAKEPVDYFNSLHIPGFKAYWIPEGVNSNSYKWLPYSEKSIDIIQYGRQWDWLHNKIESFCKEKDILYQYPQLNNSNKVQYMSRDELVDSLAKSKIAICLPRNITHPGQVGNLSTLTTRYFECMSSKCLIWGKAPEELIELFGYNPVVEIDVDNPEIQLLNLLNNYNSHIPLIEKNYHNIIHNHQWKNRIDSFLKILSEYN